MPTVSSFYGIIIQMYWRDHNPPHFHAIYAGEEVLIDIQTLEIMEGSIPRRAVTMVIDWTLAHRGELLQDWELCQRRQHPRKIEPLP